MMTVAFHSTCCTYLHMVYKRLFGFQIGCWMKMTTQCCWNWRTGHQVKTSPSCCRCASRTWCRTCPSLSTRNAMESSTWPPVCPASWCALTWDPRCITPMAQPSSPKKEQPIFTWISLMQSMWWCMLECPMMETTPKRSTKKVSQEAISCLVPVFL